MLVKMKIQLKSLNVILIFALCHAVCCIACRALEVRDDYALTLLTIAMSFIICYRRGMKVLYIIASVIVVNVLAYLMGNALPRVLFPLKGSGIWLFAVATALTTLVLGVLLDLSCGLLIKPEKKKRWVVRINDTIVPVNTEQIAYFYSADKCNYLVTYEGNRYIVDATMDSIIKELDQAVFFRINRGCILSMSCIDSAVKDAGRLQVEVHPAPSVAMTVPHSRVDEFLRWLA